MDCRYRLHRARVEKNIDLNRITAVTALSPSVVRKIDEGRFEDLPGGVYARSYVRAFAEAVGISPEEAVRDVELILPEVPDPFPALRDLARPTAGEAIRNFMRARWRRVGTRGVPLRVFAAASVDAAALLAIGALEAVLTAAICDVTVEVVLRKAGLALAPIFLVHVCLFFLIFEGIGAQTPGGALAGISRTRSRSAFRVQDSDAPSRSRQAESSL